MKQLIYLDHAAATPLDKRVEAAMRPYYSDKFYNPSATYLAARSVRQDLQKARAQVAQILGTKPAEIVFTAGGTEANNLAIKGVMEQFPDSNLIISALEHESVLAPAEKYNFKLAAPTPQGLVDTQTLNKLIDDKTVLISVMYANNEIGTIQPIRQIAQKIRAVWSERQLKGNTLPLYLHTDAAQATNYLDLHVSRLGVDLMTINGGKIYGPKQSGALFVASHVQINPQIFGGGQERGLRSGTENIAGIIGFAEALKITQQRRATESKRLTKLRDEFLELVDKKIPDAYINGSLRQRLPNNVHITITGQDNERLLMQLDELGIQAAAGSACSASSEEPSHVLRAIGLSDASAQASLRFTLGRSTTQSAIRRVAQALSDLV